MTQKPQWLISRLGSATKNLDSGLQKLAKSLLNSWNSAGVSGTLGKKQTWGDLGDFFQSFSQSQEQTGPRGFGEVVEELQGHSFGRWYKTNHGGGRSYGRFMLSLPWAVLPNFSPLLVLNRTTCAKVSCRIWGLRCYLIAGILNISKSWCRSPEPALCHVPPNPIQKLTLDLPLGPVSG